ncbi:MAG: hypothetical protein NWR72_16625 [Bacteroidia bacterium]|nr:hypothetical protein [Bacteroidia bacterium]
MKVNLRSSMLAAMAFLALGLSGCVEDSCDLTYKHAVYEPIYMSQDEFVNSVGVVSPRNVVSPGKIYTKDAILLVNELGEGVHIYDNKNPKNPQSLAFLNVPGNYDLSMNCDMLYLDSSTDMLVFDMSDPSSPRLVNRIENAFPYMAEYRGYQADPSQGVIVKWKEEIREDKYDCQVGVPNLWQQNQVDNTWDVQSGSNNTRTVNPAVPGKSGSMSRFTVLNDYLYIVGPSELDVYNVTSCDQPLAAGTQSLSGFFGVAEMITSLDNLLLIGSTGGMSIYSADDPTNPQYMSTFEHNRACDPVTAENGIAYVTLRNSQDSPCGPFWNNQLDVVDISNPSYPRLLNTFSMYNPHGVGIDGDLLFIADGDQGLKIFDASTPSEVGRKELAHFPDMNGYDVIALDGVLMFVGKDGIAQYDYSNPKDIQLLSTIMVYAE